MMRTSSISPDHYGAGARLEALTPPLVRVDGRVYVGRILSAEQMTPWLSTLDRVVGAEARRKATPADPEARADWLAAAEELGEALPDLLRSIFGRWLLRDPVAGILRLQPAARDRVVLGLLRLRADDTRAERGTESALDRLRRLNQDPAARDRGAGRIGFGLQLSLFQATYPGAYWQPWYPTRDHIIPWHLLRLMMLHRESVLAQERLSMARAIALALGAGKGGEVSRELRLAYPGDRNGR